MMHVMSSPSISVEVAYAFESVPTGLLLTIHWYIGVAPPFMGTAPKTVSSPSQIAADVTDTNTFGSNTGTTSTSKVSILDLPQQTEVVCKVISYLPVSVNVCAIAEVVTPE